jgi:hypothetical protein
MQQFFNFYCLLIDFVQLNLPYNAKNYLVFSGQLILLWLVFLFYLKIYLKLSYGTQKV